MRRVLRKIPLIVSLILLLASAGMLLRSFFVLDELSLADKEARVWAALSYRGGIHLLRSAPARAAPRSMSWDSYEIPPHDTWADLYTTAQVKWKFLGLMFLRKTGFPIVTAVPASRPGNVVISPPGPASSPPGDHPGRAASTRTAILARALDHVP